MKKEENFFLSRDGKTKIHAVKWIPEGKPVCILQIVHGMAEYIERYERLASVLTRQGILVTGRIIWDTERASGKTESTVISARTIRRRW